MACEEEFRYPHGWTEMEHSGLVIPRPVRDMLEKRDRDLEDFISGWPCSSGGEIPWFEGTGYFAGGDTVFQLTIDDWMEGSATEATGSTPGITLTPGGVWQMTLGWTISIEGTEPPPVTIVINNGDVESPSMERTFPFYEVDTDFWLSTNQMTGSFYADNGSNPITATYYPEDGDSSAWVAGHLIHERTLEELPDL